MVEGAPHTAKRSQGSIVVSLGCPLPPYIKEQGRRRPALGGGAPSVESYQDSLVLVGFHLPYGIGKEEGKKRRKERGAPLP